MKRSDARVNMKLTFEKDEFGVSALPMASGEWDRLKEKLGGKVIKGLGKFDNGNFYLRNDTDIDDPQTKGILEKVFINHRGVAATLKKELEYRKEILEKEKEELADALKEGGETEAPKR